MKTMFNQIVSFVLTFAILAGLVSLSFTGFAANDEIRLDDIANFGTSLTALISESKTASNHQKNYDDSVTSQSDKKDFEPTRLIVRSDSTLDDMGAESKVEGLLGLHIFQYKNAGTAALAYQYYLNNSKVDWVEYDRIVNTNSVAPTVDEEWLTLNGSKYLSWGADYMGIEAFTEELLDTEPETITVAVVDTGIDTDHPLFSGFYDEYANPDGRILKNGANFSESQNDIPFEDDNGHGTHVSGTVVDLTLNNVKILPVKVLNYDGFGYTSTLAAGILYAAYSGADIINMSFGGYSPDDFVQEYIIDIVYNLGVTPVASAGNETDNADYSSPGSLEKCITVGALNETLSYSLFSNYGNSIDICAPGEYIISACMGGGYVSFDGTSMAAPHVSALAALYLSKDPSLDVKALTEAVLSNAVDLGETGKDYVYGYGLAFAKADSLNTLGTIEISYSESPIISTTFENSVDVTLSCQNSDSIYYTTDGTNPLTSSSAILYNEKIEIDASTKLRAIALNRSNKAGRSVPVMRDIFIEGTDPIYKLFSNDTTIVAATGLLPTEYTIPSGYTNIGDYAFANHHEISKLYFPNSTTSVGEGSFMRCDLNRIDLNRVKSIGTVSFAGKSFFSSFDAPELINIGISAFAFNSFNKDTTFSKAEKIGDYAFFCTTIFSDLVFPKVSEVGNCAFSQCSFFSPVSVPNVKTIGDYAFSYPFFTVALNADFKNAVDIGKYAFAATYLDTLNLPKMEYINDFTFYDTKIINPINISKVKEIGNYSFFGCYEIDTLDLPLLKTVGDGAFAYCDLSQGINLPNLESVGNNSFEMTYTTELNLPKLKTAGDYAFSSDELVSVSLPELVYAGDYAFSFNPLVSFSAPKLKTIRNSAFMYCYDLASISLPSIESIGAMAFLETNILSIKLPDSVKHIGTRAFNDQKDFDYITTIIANKNSYAEQYANDNDYPFVATGTEFTVTYYNARGREISVQKVLAGDAATDPKGPFRLFMTFLGWDTDTSCVSSDLEVYPIYESVFTVLLDRILLFFLNLFGVIYY